MFQLLKVSVLKLKKIINNWELLDYIVTLFDTFLDVRLQRF